ncbi:hypothetical protein [Rothia sp. L_38]|uniref:hypothetical protein n=1 Tax=Rothia sp. L_38 TaxID=3422315 RepID=UPI003D6BDD4A
MQNNQTGNNNNNAQGNGNFVGSVVNGSTINMVFSTTKDGEKQTYEAKESKYLTLADSWLSIAASLATLLGAGGLLWIYKLISAGYHSSKDILSNLSDILDSRILMEGNYSFPELIVPFFIFILCLCLVMLLLALRKFGRNRIMHLFWWKSKYFFAGFSKNGKNRIGLFKITGECKLCSGSKRGSLRAYMMPTEHWVIRNQKTGKKIKSKPLKESGKPVLVCQRNSTQHIFDINLTDYRYEL